MSKVPPRQSKDKYPELGEIPSMDFKVDVTSGQPHKSPNRLTFSPMTKSDGKYRGFPCFENYWQSGKRYKELGHTSIENKKKDIEWLKTIDKPYRRHPKARGLIPFDAIYPDITDIPMDYVTSRKMVYVPLYSKLINNKEQLDFYQKHYRSGKNILVVDYDGPKVSSTKEDVVYERPCLPVTLDLLQSKINDTNFQFGHGYIVAAMIMGINHLEYII